MNAKKRTKLAARGWTTGDAKDFLGLSNEESTLIEFRLALAEHLKAQRLRKKLSQVEVAKLLASSQSRVAKMEAGDESVSIDLLLRALLRLGASARQIANTMNEAA